jgi:hypothetical protein
MQVKEPDVKPVEKILMGGLSPSKQEESNGRRGLTYFKTDGIVIDYPRKSSDEGGNRW